MKRRGFLAAAVGIPAVAKAGADGPRPAKGDRMNVPGTSIVPGGTFEFDGEHWKPLRPSVSGVHAQFNGKWVPIEGSKRYTCCRCYIQPKRTR